LFEGGEGLIDFGKGRYLGTEFDIIGILRLGACFSFPILDRLCASCLVTMILMRKAALND
jgi:hypothetical protein